MTVYKPLIHSAGRLRELPTGDSLPTNVLGYTPVNKAGDTMTGELTLTHASEALITLNPIAAQYGTLKFQDGGIDKWLLYKEANNDLVLYNNALSQNAFLIQPDGRMSIGANAPHSLAGKLYVVNTAHLSGRMVYLNCTQTQVNTTDTSDAALHIGYTLSASSALNQNIVRVFSFGGVNDLTGGGVVTQFRCFSLFANTNTGTTATDLDILHISAGTANGIVTRWRAMRVTGGQGVSQAGIAIAALSTGTNHTSVLIGTNTIPSGNYALHSTSTYDSYLAGKLGLNKSTSLGAQLHIVAPSATKGLIVQGAASTTIAEFQDSGGNIAVLISVNGAAVFNEQGADADFRIEGDTDVNLLFGDASTDRLGIGTATPNSKLDVVGTIQVDGLRVDVTPTAETPSMTHTFTVSLNGTNYKIPVVAA